MIPSLKDEISSFFPGLDAEIDKIRERRTRLGLSTPNNIEVKLNFNMEEAGSQFYIDGISTIFLSPLAAALADQTLWNTDEEKKLTRIGQYLNRLRWNIFYRSGKVEDEHILEVLDNPSKISNYKELLESRLECSFDKYAHYVQEISPSIKTDLISLIPRLKRYWPSCLPKVLAHEIDHSDFDENNKEIVARIHKAQKIVFQSEKRTDKVNASKIFLTDYLEYAPRYEGRALVFIHLDTATSQDDLREKVLYDLNRYIEKNFIKDFLIPLFYSALAEIDKESRISDKEVDETFFFAIPEIQKLNWLPVTLKNVDQSKVNFKLVNAVYSSLRSYKTELQKNAEQVSKEYANMFAKRQ